MDNLSLKLLAGLPISIEEVGRIKQLTLKEIAEIGEENYNHYLSLLCFDISDLALESEIEDLRSFDVIVSNCLHSEEFLNKTTFALALFFDEEINFIKEYGFFYFGEITDQRFIHRENYDDIKNILMKVNCIKSNDKEEKIEPGNERAKQFMEKLKQLKKEIPKKKKDEINLYSIVSGVAWKSHIGINNVWDLTVYQLYDAFYRLDIVDNYDRTLQGIYAGTIDMKKTDLKKINWYKSIEFS